MGEGFENVKDQIGFCGIWCGSCLGGNGAIQELTRKYEQVIKHSQSALEKYASKEFKFNEFVKGLGYVQAMQLCPGCRKGGGNSACEVRICALGKSVTRCSQCDALVECKHFEPLEKGHPQIKEELMKIKDASQREVIEKWINELKTKWPHCVLLCETGSRE